MKKKTIQLKQRAGTSKFHVCMTLLGWAGLLWTSCNDETECIHMDDLWIGRATVVPTESDFSLLTDGGRHLTVVSTYSGNYVAKENQRVFVRYALLDREEGTDKYKVNLYDIQNILTKNVADLTAENDAQFGNDPVRVYRLWCAGGYLNVNFGFNYGGTVTHTVNLVANQTAERPDNGKIHLEFRHNAFGDPEEVAHLGTVCFNLKPYKREEGETLTFVITFREFGVDSSYEIKYDFQTDHTAPEGNEETIGEWGYK